MAAEGLSHVWLHPNQSMRVHTAPGLMISAKTQNSFAVTDSLSCNRPLTSAFCFFARAASIQHCLCLLCLSQLVQLLHAQGERHSLFP